MSSSIDDAYGEAILSALLDGLVVIPPAPVLVLLGDLVLLRIVDFLRLLTWFSREFVEWRKKFNATRCGILRNVCGGAKALGEIIYNCAVAPVKTPLPEWRGSVAEILSSGWRLGKKCRCALENNALKRWV